MVQIDTVMRGSTWVAPLADAFAAEWPEWASGIAREALEGNFASDPGGGLPLVLVAHRGGEILGTIALRHGFAEQPMPESPWVRGLLVLRPHRGRGVDRVLMRAVEEGARQRGYAALHAATTSIERLLARRGWQVFRRIEHNGEPMAWMRRAIAPARGGTPCN